MKKILLIFLLFAMVTSIYSNQTDLDKDISLARKIFQTEKEKHSCILSPKETEDAAKSYLKLGLFTRICGRNPVQGVRQAGDISTLLQF